MTSQTGKQILLNIPRSIDNQSMRHHLQIEVEKLVPGRFIYIKKLDISLDQESEMFTKFVFIACPSVAPPKYFKAMVLTTCVDMT